MEGIARGAFGDADIDNEVFLFLDDYHLVTDPAIRGAVSFLPGIKCDGQRRLWCALMKANQRSPPPRGRLLTALAAPGTGSGDAG